MSRQSTQTVWVVAASLGLALAGSFYVARGHSTATSPSAPRGSGPVFSDGPRQLAPLPLPTRTTPPAPEGLSENCMPVEGPATVDASTLPPDGQPVSGEEGELRGAGRPEMPISEEEAERLRQLSYLLPPSPNVQVLDEAPLGVPFSLGTNFDGIDTSECCGAGSSVPPDPEMAAGPSHLIVVVNTAFKVFGLDGTTLVGPTRTDTLFGNLAGCTGTFDPNAAYDEQSERFVIGVDDANAYCLAVTQTSDPTGVWNLYRIPTLHGPATLFDYPHVGIGDEAIMWGSNQFAGGFVEGRVWAIDKAAVYTGQASPTCRTQSTGDDSTPWPAVINIGGSGDPFPTEHYFMTEVFDGANHSVWRWDNPLGGGNAVNTGSVDLNAATGVVAGFPIDAPQMVGGNIQANDWRGQSTRYVNGHLWMTNQAIACNPGGGTVDCARWAQIDPTGGAGGTPSVVQAGVFASTGEFRLFASIAVNRCDDALIGFSKTSASIFPGVYVAGRASTTPPGLLEGELQVHAGEVSYVSFDPAPHRWGDYSGMTIGPDGESFWYLGEYSKNGVVAAANWGNWVGKLTFDQCANSIFADGFESGNTNAWDTTVN